MQVIEGNENDIDQLYKNLKIDFRHHDVIELIREPIPEREFPDWRMSYLNVSSENIVGFSEFLREKGTHVSSDFIAGKAKEILLQFREILR